ncbi:ATPase, partial [Burkholderia mallei]
MAWKYFVPPPLTAVDNEFSPVDSDEMLLLAVLRPVELDVDRELRLLLVVLSPVDSEPMPVDVEVDSDVIAL